MVNPRNPVNPDSNNWLLRAPSKHQCSTLKNPRNPVNPDSNNMLQDKLLHTVKVFIIIAGLLPRLHFPVILVLNQDLQDFQDYRERRWWGWHRIN
jgi:hypothetical protein